MTPHARLLLAPALTASLALAGCGITNPYSPPRQASPTPRPQAATRAPRARSQTVTDPSDPPPSKPTTTASAGVTADSGNRGAASARQALELYTRLYINWNSQTIGEHQRQLAALSRGTARANALQAAASYGRDPTLTSSRVSNAGSVLSVAPGEGPERGGWVIVTSERTTGQGDYAGLPAATHVTYAHVIHTRNGWMVTQWSPQS